VVPEWFQNNNGYNKKHCISDEKESLEYPMKKVAHDDLLMVDTKLIKNPGFTETIPRHL
jgi:hypothetical protein